MKRHIQLKHTNQRPFACAYCDHAAKLKSDLKKHEERCLMKLQHRQQQYYWKRVFEQASETVPIFLQNQPTKIGREQFACPFCSKIEKSAWKCRRHISIHHTFEKPFTCSYCPHSCLQRSDMIRHERNHFKDGFQPRRVPHDQNH